MSEKIVVDPMDPSKKNSTLSGPISGEATVILDQAKNGCTWNDQSFPEGAVVESEATCYECSFGQWVKKS